MLKKIWRLFLGLVVCTGSACVTPTHASSAQSVILVSVQAASPQSAKDEAIVLYNNSSQAIDISNWCLKNKANISFTCLNPESGVAYSLPSHTYATIVSQNYLDAHQLPPDTVSCVFQVTNQSSGSLVNSNDSVTLIDARGVEVDRYAWNAAIPSGKAAMRLESVVHEGVYETLDLLLDWSYGVLSLLPEQGLQEVEQEGEVPSEQPPDDSASTTPSNVLHPIITEMLPNPSGADTGREFIELYNPSPDTPIELALYMLKIGVRLEKSYQFPEGATLAPGEYRAFTNAEIRYTLLNTTSSAQLYENEKPLEEPIVYSNPPEGKSYALVDAQWAYTMPTPGTVNRIEPPSNSAVENDAAASTVKPCAANQYRNPETGRCRLLVAASTPSPCKVGQERNPETNRCRAISSSSNGQAACKVGQERNPETNRCRNSVKMTNAGHGIESDKVASAQRGVGWYWWVAIGGVVLLILTYAVWEWREELVKLHSFIKRKLARMK